MFFSAALGLVLFSGAPIFRLDYEVDSVILHAEHDPALFSRFVQRMERAAKGGGARITFIQDGVQTIQTFTPMRSTTDIIRPDGKRQSVSGPINSDKNPWVPLTRAAKLVGLKMLYSKDTKETRTIAGIKCSKHVRGFEFEDATYETIEWTALDSSRSLPPLERYEYRVDLNERKLTLASIATSVKLGKTPSASSGRRRP